MRPRCNPPTLLVAGASGRALAQSGHRAGIPMLAADLFRDADLVEACVAAVRVDRYPDGILDAAASLPATAWCYVGGLENRPDLIDSISSRLPLAGSPAEAVRLVRDPAWLASRSAECGLAMPSTSPRPDGIPCDGSHLVKPLDAAGGHGIHRWTGGEIDHRPRVWQRIVEGTPLSACFLAGDGGVDLLLVSRQLVGWPPSRGGEFAWCGGVTRRLPGAAAAMVSRLGRHVAGRAGLRGLFGIDFMGAADGGVHPLEVNPRPTASMELWERAGRGSLAASHLSACGVANVPFTAAAAPLSEPLGKAVLFAASPVIVAERTFGRWMEWREAWRDQDGHAALADLPPPGTTIPRGGPVLTVFASAATEPAVLELLAQRLESVDRSLEATPAVEAEPSPQAAAGWGSVPPDRGTP